MALQVGLTGGIGSGKSTVARIFEVLGIPVYYADDAARRLQNTDPVLKQQIIRLLGEKAYEGGQLDRKYVASIVFSDPEKLRALNALVHPVTIRDAREWMAGQSSPYAIKEAALIFESGSHRELDCVIGVFAPGPVRVGRIIRRDGVTAGEVAKRMEKQISDSIMVRLCDFVIHNDETQLVIPQVLAIHGELLKRSAVARP